MSRLGARSRASTKSNRGLRALKLRVTNPGFGRADWGMSADLTEAETNDVDLTAADVAWDLEPIIPDGESMDSLLDQADAMADKITERRGTIASLDANGLAGVMHEFEDISNLMSKSGHYAMLKFSENTIDPERGA